MTALDHDSSEQDAEPSRLTDEEFVQAFEECRISGALFHHRDHVRLAWIYLNRHPFPEASDRMVASIKRFAMHNAGNLEKYHETVTRSWMRLVNAAIRENGCGPGFDDFAKASPKLLDMKVLSSYYSKDLLNGSEARATWVEPDIQPLP
jgi:hypothetical protein